MGSSPDGIKLIGSATSAPDGDPKDTGPAAKDKGPAADPAPSTLEGDPESPTPVRRRLRPIRSTDKQGEKPTAAKKKKQQKTAAKKKAQTDEKKAQEAADQLAQEKLEKEAA